MPLHAMRIARQKVTQERLGMEGENKEKAESNYFRPQVKLGVAAGSSAIKSLWNNCGHKHIASEEE